MVALDARRAVDVERAPRRDRPAGCPPAPRTRRRAGRASRAAAVPTARRRGLRPRGSCQRGQLGSEERRRDVALAAVGQHDRDPLALGLGARRDLRAPPTAPRRRRSRTARPRGGRRARAVSIASSSSTAMISSSRSRSQHRRDEARADALDLVRAGTAAGEHRRGRGLDGDHLDVLVALLQERAGAGDRPAGADAGDEVVDLAVQRLPQLRAGRAGSGRPGWPGSRTGRAGRRRGRAPSRGRRRPPRSSRPSTR